MTSEWNIKCKNEDCNNILGYSDRSFKSSLLYGFSRPEYCEECQNDEVKMRAGIGAPYFHVPHIEGELLEGPLGKIFREERTHEVTEKDSGFDIEKFGITEENIRAIADWFKDPDQRVVVVVGPTGSGKSTALPFFLVYPPEGIEENFFTKDGQILVTQPRIVAVTGISEYLASDLMGSTVGAGFDIGYRYSKEDKADWRNVIELTTDGKFINALVSGRITQYGLIIIDEAHERSENIEVILRLLKDRMGLYPNLKLIIASATIDKKFFRSYFDKEGATIVDFEGKARKDADGNLIEPPDPQFASEYEKLPYEEVGKLSKPILWATKKKVQWIIKQVMEGRKDWGDILVFLQGKRPIDTLVEQLKSWANQDEELSKIVEVYPLYRDIEKEDKDKALASAKEGKLKVVISTNIAEASVTVEGVVYEVETGIEYQPKYNAAKGCLEVPLVLISKANARQRWGRTGRTRSGEVFCLYTQSQFEELFLEYPIPDMQRVSMESVVLTAKAAGIPNVMDGWLENPPEKEIDRSTKELVTAGALGKNGSLTNYGAMIRRFSYSVKLIDLLLAADDVGCVVEVATLLPVIKNGGTNRILSWNFLWDSYTKRLAYKRHQALMAGCKDDVEFILKVYKTWDELAWLSKTQLGKLTDEEKDSLREQWAKLHFVNSKVLDSIKEERDSALEVLRVSMKTKDPRKINFRQLNRVRSLLLGMLDEKECLIPDDPYQFDSRIEPEDGTVVTCKVYRGNLKHYDPKIWFETGFVPTKSNEELESRLLVEQIYTIGHRFLATVEGTKDGHTWIRTRTNLTRKKVVEEVQEVSVIEDAYDVEVNVEDEYQDDKLEETEPEISLSKIPIWYSRIMCQKRVSEMGDWEKDDELEVEIVGYEFPSNSLPIVVTKVISKPEPFDVFKDNHRYSDEVEVEVTGVLQFQNDFNAALIVRDKETNLEVLLEAQDLSFTRDSFAVKQIPEGSTLVLNVEHIDKRLRRVRLSNWGAVERVLNKHLVKSKSGGNSVTPADVLEVRNNGKVLFLLRWSKPEEGVSLITSAHGGILPKEYTEFEDGEEVFLNVFRKEEKTAYTNLSKLPNKARSEVSEEEKKGELSWNREVLRFSGRMPYGKLYNLKTIAEDVKFHKTLEDLYWYSNRIFIKEFLDSEWQETVTEQYEVGSTSEGTVLQVSGHGAELEVAGGIKGFAPASRILGGKISPSKILSVGDTVSVTVKEQRLDEQELLFEINDKALDPLNNISRGMKSTGEIMSIAKFGLFVNVAQGINGLVHISNVYKNKRKTLWDIYKEGDQVIYEVLDVNLGKREVSLSMLLPENDPLENLEEGDTLKGTIININEHGAFIELAPQFDINGLIWEEDYPVSTSARANIEVGVELIVRVRSINISDRKISFEYVRRSK